MLYTRYVKIVDGKPMLYNVSGFMPPGATLAPEGDYVSNDLSIVDGVIVVDNVKKTARLAYEAQENINVQAKQYLASTDWYIIRHQETGASIPQEILDARAAARASVHEQA